MTELGSIHSSVTFFVENTETLDANLKIRNDSDGDYLDKIFVAAWILISGDSGEHREELIKRKSLYVHV